MNLMMRFLLSFLVILLLSPTLILAQFPQGSLQPLGDVLMIVLDSNKDNKVDMSEVQQQLAMLEMIFQEDQGGEYMKLLKAVQKAAPKIFELLDVNSNKSLSKSELKWLTKFEKSLPAKATPTLRQFVREAFALLDENKDDKLSPEEWAAAKSKLSTLAQKFHDLFPLRKTAQEMEDILGTVLVGISKDDQNEASRKVFDWLDTDKDGSVSRQEVGRAYSTGAKKWMEISKTIKDMGPMMAMFGGGGMGGGMDGMKMEF